MAATAATYVPTLQRSNADPGLVSDTISGLNAVPYATGQLGKWTWVYPTTSYWNTFSLGSKPIAIQYVTRSATDASTIALGTAAFIKDYDDCVVTGDSSDSLSDANNIYNCVGVWLGASPAVGKGGFIAIGGVAAVKLKGSPTVAADATGALVAVPETTVDLLFDCIGVTQFNATTGTPSETTNADKIRQVVAKVLSVKNTPTGIGTDVVKGLLFPYGGVGGI